MKNPIFNLPDFFKKNASEALSNATTEFPQLDLDGLAEEWKIAEIGKYDGQNNIPLNDAVSPSSNEQKLIATFSGVIGERKNQAISQIQEYERLFRNTALSEKVTKLSNFARNAKNQFESIIQRADDHLFAAKDSFENLTKKFQKFKSENRLEYSPHYPPSRIFYYAVLIAEILIETILNFNFFKNVAEDYIVGGVYNAFLLSIVNVFILGFVFGKYLFWNANHINNGRKLFGWTSLILFIFLAVGLNFFVANYRIVSLFVTENQLTFNFSMVLANMISFEYPAALNDWFLFLIGLVAAIIAFVTSYKMDDSYPGYGDLHRKLEEARYDYINTKEEIESSIIDTKDQQIKSINKISDELTLQHNVAAGIVKDEESYLVKWKNAFEYIETACRFCVTKYRENNESQRPTEKIKCFKHPFKFDENYTFENNIEENKKILKEVTVFVDQIGKHRTEAEKEIINNYEVARDRFKVIEQNNKL